jgi:deazaflavin-dependent oxidoreductase (nitroreductase family)
MILPDDFWVRIKPVQRLHQRLYAAGMGWVIGWFVLLLTHTGRKSGKRYLTPLQYEKINGAYYVGAGRGMRSDWFRNVLADRRVHVQAGRHAFDCLAEPVTETGRVADFLAYRLKRHPLMIGLIMKFAHHMPLRPSRTQLLELSRSTALVILCPPNQAV